MLTNKVVYNRDYFLVRGVPFPKVKLLRPWSGPSRSGVSRGIVSNNLKIVKSRYIGLEKIWLEYRNGFELINITFAVFEEVGQ